MRIRFHFGENMFKGLDDIRVELYPGIGCNLGFCLGGRQGLAVRPVGCKRVIDVCDSDYPGPYRYAVAYHGVVPAAVIALVVVEYERKKLQYLSADGFEYAHRVL